MGVIAGPLLAGVLIAAVVAYDWRWLAPHRRWILVLPAIVVPLLVPWLVPVTWVYARALLTVSCIVMAGKAYELLRGRVPDARMLSRPRTFAFWMLVPPQSRLPADAAEAARNRAEGRRRFGRALLKLPPVAGLTWLHLRVPALHDDPWIEAFWALWLTYFAVSAVVDVAGAVAMQTGNFVAESFHAPPLARSPRDFWSRRWNLVVHDLVFRHVFLPLGGLRKPLRSTLGVFLMSGLIHEYFVLVCLGRPSAHTGWMMAFFGLHGLAVMVQLWWDRGPGRRREMRRSLAVTLHLGWMTLTSPLFFAPIGELFRDAWPN